MKRVVVTGIGVVTSIGIGIEDFWENLLLGKSGICKVESFDTSNHATHYGGEIKNFDPKKYIHYRKCQFMGRTSLLAIVGTKLALQDANLNLKDYDADRIGISIGTTSGEAQEIEMIDRVWALHGENEVYKRRIRKYPVDHIPSNLANTFGIKGPIRIFTTACAAGNYSIGYGYDLICKNKVSRMIVGGADTFSYASFTGFNQLGAVAPEKCQPFDKNRKGMIPGEGVGILILESLDDALKRNSKIYAEILGYGLSCDAHHITNPQLDGIANCMVKALYETHLSPKDVDYICAHGTGTRHNDVAEAGALNKIFGKKIMDIPVSSIKSMLGHTMGAASAIEAIACCMVVKNNKIPPTINFETPDPECNINCVPNKMLRKNVNIALNNAFAFGGNNSSVVIAKYKE